jgi:cell division protein FtsB
MLQILLINLNAAACAVIALRLLFFRKSGEHRPGMAWLAYFLILASSWTSFRIWHGDYVVVDYGELSMNIVVCVAILRAKGNIAKIAGESA